MRIAAGIIGVLLVLAIIYYFLPSGVKRAVNPFYKGPTVVRTSPAPTSRSSAVSSDAPDLFVTATTTPLPSGSVLAQATARATATATPRASGSATADPFASASPAGTRVAGLPGTGEETRSPELLVIELLASVLVLMFGYKLSKHL